MFQVEPDKLDTKKTHTCTWFSIYHALLADFMAKNSKTNKKQTQFHPNAL